MSCEFAMLACGSPFTGAEAMMIMVGLASLLVGAIFAVLNLVFMCLAEHHGARAVWPMIPRSLYVGARSFRLPA